MFPLRVSNFTSTKEPIKSLQASKLFMNDREKLSLCYYASSLIDKIKGILVVYSGVEFKNFSKESG